MRTAALLALTLALPGPAFAQADSSSDPRILTLTHLPGGLMRIPTSAATTQVLMLPQGEHVVAATISDPTAFAITVSGTSDSIAVRAAGPRSLAVLSVRTEASAYTFELSGGDGTPTPAPLVVRVLAFQRPMITAPTASLPGAARFSYRVSGNAALRPISISDDGQKTYIEWRHDQSMPATFALTAAGAEQMVEGYVRGKVFTIDRVYGELIFRIDRDSARAVRDLKHSRHG